MVTVDGMDFEVRVLGIDEFNEFSEWCRENQDPTQICLRLVSLCCPVFNGDPPESLLRPGHIVELAGACRRLNSVGGDDEADTAKN